MRIDSHVHGMHAERNASGKLCPPLVPIWKPGVLSPGEHIQRSIAEGVEKVLVLDPPNVTFALKEIFGDYVLPCPQIDIDHTAPEEVDELFKLGAVGIKFICPAKSYGDDAYFPVYDVICANQGLAVFHTGYVSLEMFEPGGVMRRKHIVDITDMRPAALDRVGRAFPQLKIIMAHFGNPWWEEAWTIIAKHPNIYADISGGTGCKRPLTMWKNIFTLDDQINLKSFAKLCFGTDCTPFIPGQGHFARHIEFYEKLFEFLSIPKEIRELVNRGNMIKLLE